MSLLAIVLLTAGYEAVREASRRYEAYASRVTEGRRGGDDLRGELGYFRTRPERMRLRRPGVLLSHSLGACDGNAYALGRLGRMRSHSARDDRAAPVRPLKD